MRTYSLLRRSFSLLAAVAGLALAPLAHAVTVTVDMTADIYFASSGVSSLTGQTINVNFTYDSTTPDLFSHTGIGHYEDALTTANVSVGGFSANLWTVITSYLSIYNDLAASPGGVVDGVGLDFSTTSNSVGGVSLIGFGLVLYSPDNVTTAFSSDALPTSGAGWPGAGAFTGYNTLTLSFSNNSYATATVTSITASAPGVPDGGSVGLLAGAALLLGAAVHRRTRCA